MDVSPAFTEIKYLLENTWGKGGQGPRGGGEGAGQGGCWPEAGEVRGGEGEAHWTSLRARAAESPELH